MHGNLQQNARARALADFKAGKTRVLIATDVAGRGIDIGQLPCVINYELPRSPNDYTHRIGRTGRAGEQGTAISLISHNDYNHFKVIEKRIGARLEREQITGLEADENAPEAPKRTQPKKKTKGKKRKVLVDKKKASVKEKELIKKEQERIESKAKKEKFREKAIFERNVEKEKRASDKDKAESRESTKPASSSFYGKAPKLDQSKAEKPKAEKPTYYSKPEGLKDSTATKSERVSFDDTSSDKTAPKKKPAEKPSTGASLYTRKLPKDGDA